MSDLPIPRRQFLAALGAGATFGAGLLLSNPTVASSDETSQQPPIGSTATPLPLGVKSINGTWFGDILAPDGTLLFRGMATFTPGGGMMTTGENDVSASEPRGTGHGSWRQDGRHVDTRLLKFIYNSTLELVAIYEEFLSGDMDESGDTFIAEAIIYLYDLEGNRIATRGGTITAKRLLLNQTLGDS